MPRYPWLTLWFMFKDSIKKAEENPIPTPGRSGHWIVIDEDPEWDSKYRDHLRERLAKLSEDQYKRMMLGDWQYIEDEKDEEQK